MAWVLDLDGVVWRGTSVIPGAPDAIARLLANGQDVFYCTNNSAMAAQGYVDRLASMGIEADEAHIIHGGHAVARLVEPGERVLVCAGAGVVEGLKQQGAVVVTVDQIEGLDVPPVDAVVIGWLLDFDYRRLNLATRAVRNGARLLAPSGDPLYPTADGSVLLGGGALTAAVTYATHVEPTIAGKPHQPIADVTQARVGTIDLVVGDQVLTDGGLAQKLGVPFALVWSGVTPKAHGPVDLPVAYAAADLAGVVDAVSGGVR